MRTTSGGASIPDRGPSDLSDDGAAETASFLCLTAFGPGISLLSGSGSWLFVNEIPCRYYRKIPLKSSVGAGMPASNLPGYEDHTYPLTLARRNRYHYWIPTDRSVCSLGSERLFLPHSQYAVEREEHDGGNHFLRT